MDFDGAAVATMQDSKPWVDLASVEGMDDLSPGPKVTARDKKKLTIRISQARNRGSRKYTAEEEEDEDYDPPSSAEIEVIHTQPSPPLHSILKQRTVSESSEDFNLDLESPRSPFGDYDEFSLIDPGKRRSVSFSKHIDRATFKSSASVSSMKTALKSKRKRQRKWEERRDKGSGRRRHNSTGSEGSGDDSGHHSDSHCHSEDDTGHHSDSHCHSENDSGHCSDSHCHSEDDTGHRSDSHCHSEDDTGHRSDSHCHSEEEQGQEGEQEGEDGENEEQDDVLDVRTKQSENKPYSQNLRSSLGHTQLTGDTGNGDQLQFCVDSLNAVENLGSAGDLENQDSSSRDSKFVAEPGTDVSKEEVGDSNDSNAVSTVQQNETVAESLSGSGIKESEDTEGSCAQVPPEGSFKQAVIKKGQLTDEISAEVAEEAAGDGPEVLHDKEGEKGEGQSLDVREGSNEL